VGNVRETVFHTGARDLRAGELDNTGRPPPGDIDHRQLFYCRTNYFVGCKRQTRQRCGIAPAQLKITRQLKNITSEGKLRATGAQLPECMWKYMRIASTVCAQVAERSSFTTACYTAAKR
jgi:hypothetical protein